MSKRLRRFLESTHVRNRTLLREVNAKLDELLAAPRPEDELEEFGPQQAWSEEDRDAWWAQNRRPKR